MYVLGADKKAESNNISIHNPSQTPDLDNTTLGLNEQRRKGLAHPHNAQHVRVKHTLHLVDVDVKCRNGIVAPGIIDEVIKFAPGEL